MSVLGMLGKQAAGAAISGGMGMVFGGLQRKQQLKQQQKLQDMQIKGQKELGKYQKDLDLQMWKDTNYGAQRRELENAGLNAGLLYGQSGGGGATTGGGGMGLTGASAGDNTEAQAGAGLGMVGMQAASQLALMKAQKENIEADTANKQAGAENLGADTTKKGAETENTRIDTQMKKIDLYIKGMTQATTISQIKSNLEKTDAEIGAINANESVTRADAQYLQQTINTRVAQTIQQAVKLSGEIQLTNAQARYLTEQIKVEYSKLDFAQKSLDQQKEIVADTLESMIKGKWIDAGSRVVGDLINLIPNVKGLFGKIETLVEQDRYDKDGNQTGSTRTSTTTKRK